MPDLPIYLDMLIGGGIIVMLFSINKQLGCIKAELKNLAHVQADHETRLRLVEASVSWFKNIMKGRSRGQS